MKNLTFRTRSAPPALLFFCLVSFGLMIPWLGFYWDDWPSVWYLHLLGPIGFKDVFAIDRPLLGWIFMATTSIFGESTLGWQLFGILARWGSSLALWWTLRLLWPQRTREVTYVALLYAVYPGFLQQYISVTYSNTWIILIAFFLSLGLMIWAVRRPRLNWLLMAASWLLAAFAMFSSEYYFFLEFLRPVFLWMALGEQIADLRSRVKQVALRWAPYLAVMAIFLYWRIFLLQTPRGQIHLFDQVAANPLSAGLALIQTILHDMFQASFLAWAGTLNLLNVYRMGRILAAADVLVILVTAAAAVFYLARLKIEPDGSPANTSPAASKHWANQAILIGLLALFLGGWSFWITDLPIRLKFPWDRFNLAMMLGASLLFAGLVERLLNNQLQKAILLGVAVGLAAGMHFQNANTYRLEWQAQKDLFWQLAWRAPQIKPGTTLLTTDLPLKYYSDNSLTAPLNWVYASGNTSRQMEFMLYDIKVRLGNGLDGLGKGQAIYQPYRATDFTGSTSQALVFYLPPSGCLQVLDPVFDPGFPLKQKLLSDAIPISDPINTLGSGGSPARLPANLFGSEPQPGWCYYFEKAELARQAGAWKQIVDLGEQASQNGLQPANATELLPFIEGYARGGNQAKAQELSLQALQMSPRVKPVLCSTWDRLSSTTSEPAAQPAQTGFQRDRLNCN